MYGSDPVLEMNWRFQGIVFSYTEQYTFKLKKLPIGGGRTLIALSRKVKSELF